MPLIRKPKVVIFDFNGTLLDDLHVAYGSIQKIFRTYGISCPTLNQYREEMTGDYMKFYFRYGLPRTTTSNKLNAIRNEFYRTNGGSAHIRIDVRLTLDWFLIVGFHTAIVSAEVAATINRYLMRDSLQRKFDLIMPEACSKGMKEKALLEAADIFHCSPGDMIYIDDTVGGLTAAKNAGSVPVAFTNSTGYNSEYRLLEVTDLSVRNIGDIKDIIPRV